MNDGFDDHNNHNDYNGYDSYENYSSPDGYSRVFASEQFENGLVPPRDFLGGFENLIS